MSTWGEGCYLDEGLDPVNLGLEQGTGSCSHGIGEGRLYLDMGLDPVHKGLNQVVTRMEDWIMFTWGWSRLLPGCCHCWRTGSCPLGRAGYFPASGW